MTLSLYLARRFLSTFLAVLAAFLVIVFLIDMVEQIRRFAGEGVGLAGTAGLAALNTPEMVYRILPLITILAAIALFLALSRSSELVVIRAAGRSALRSLAAPVAAAVVVGAFAVAVLNPLVAATSRAYEARANVLSRGDGSVLSVSREGLWLREGSADGQRVIRAARANLDGTELIAVSFMDFPPPMAAGERLPGGPLRRIEAASATLARGAWVLADAKLWDFARPNPERDATRAARLEVPTTLTPEQIRDSFGTPSAIPIWELRAFIDNLDRAGFAALEHRVWFQMELALPLLMAAMVLVAAGFTMRHARAGHRGLLVLMAVLAGFVIFFLRNFAQVMGENGQIPVAVAAWSPPVAAVLLSLGLLLHLEEG
ncbi:MAG: LPS export ABC transporter permease LptG [Rhodobacteraceae bacterium]|jgi:lipopolysaccharide export system permease protein|nr:LPS export ABC transporter permease LptG [Paracoccaceae bacterium]